VEFSWKSIILLAGGLFLLAKGTYEIHHTVEGEDDVKMGVTRSNSLFSTIAQIMVLDIVFSLDSVITAVGMTQVIPIMIIAVVIAILVMLLAAGPVSNFIANHPTTKMLALSFLLLVGVALIADGLHFHIPRGYLYFAISFSILVEVLNLWAKNHRIKKQSQSTQ
jgi:predicted tellurium resistance membrane protein TerC